jgi:hypothetical protein
MIVSTVTTLDNPYNPWTQFDEWYAFDIAHGYHTCALLDRFVPSSSDTNPEDDAAIAEAAIDELVDVLPYYKKVSIEAGTENVESDEKA